MSGTALAFLGASIGGAAVASVVASRRTRRPPHWSVRTNVVGRAVPAILGDGLVAGAFAALGGMAVARVAGWGAAPPTDLLSVTGLVIAVMYGAGHLDDRRGDEKARGFGGHLGALRHGRLTGGMVKILAGAIAGASAGIVLHSGTRILSTALLVALSANFLNLLDRAPGRAGKFALLALAPLSITVPAAWGLSAAGLLGAVAALLWFDLGERGMLGDAGANPVGAVLGLGAALGPSEASAWVAVAVLAGATAASERWSFSAGIERVPPLRFLDKIGRRAPGGEEVQPK